MHFMQDEIPRDMQPQLLNALAQLMITQANEVCWPQLACGFLAPQIKIPIELVKEAFIRFEAK